MHVIRGSWGCRIAPASLAMAVVITLKTLQQQTFKIRMEPEETVRAGARVAGATGCRGGWGQGGLEPTGGAGRTCGRALLPSLSGPTSSDPPDRPCPTPAARPPFPAWTQGESPGSGVSCRLRVPACKLLGWPSLASVAKRCQLVTTMLMIINGLNLNSFGGPCLLAVYSFPLSSC